MRICRRYCRAWCCGDPWEHISPASEEHSAAAGGGQGLPRSYSRRLASCVHPADGFDEVGTGGRNRPQHVLEYCLIFCPTCHIWETSLSGIDAEVRARHIRDSLGDALILG